jgi:amidophosphoribosyltransferase
MCGIVGVVTQRDERAAVQIYDALTMIQHRGQDAAGISTCEDNRLFLRKENGLVRDVFSDDHMLELRGHMGIGHCRYPTSGSSQCAEAQPFYVNSPYGITLAHNGTLNNTEQLTSDLFHNDLRHLNTESDSEVLLNVFAHELAEIGTLDLQTQHVFDAVSAVHKRCQGAYAVVGMILGYGVFGFRDPHGIRPLVIGKREGEVQDEYMLSSESVALTAMGFTLLRDVRPGEAIFIDADGRMFCQQCCDPQAYTPCIFEYVYLARPDSMIDGVSVYKSRLRMGDKLADKIKRVMPDHDIDVVIPIPDTSRTSALPIAHHLGVKYREGFIKNRYIGRTFIMPGQQQRKKSIKQKLHPIRLEFEGKNVLLVDDSIVRGNTSQQIVQMAREAGAKKVYIASAAPPIRFPNVYGIDMPASYELIAYGRNEEEVCQELGADKLIYQDLDDLLASVIEGNPEITDCDTSCFDGRYITEGVTPEYLQKIEQMRNDHAKDTTLPLNLKYDVKVL